jgi:hypothetical protein
MRDSLKIINIEFKDCVLQLLKSQRSEIVNHLKNHKEEYLKLNVIQRFVAIDKYINALSFYKDDEVIETIKNLGLIKYTPKVFMSYLDFFMSLDEFQEKSKYLYPTEIIWGYYKFYSSSVIKEKMALDFKIDLSAIAGRINRQINNQDFPKILTEVIEDSKIIFDFVKKDIPDFKIDISNDNPFTSMTHRIKYSHKNDLYNLYIFLLDFNKKIEWVDFYEPDFKVEFYDLLEIILREKALLNNGEQAISNYETLRRFKIKRVERLILS